MTTQTELPNGGGGWKGKTHLWVARKALALFKRAAMSEARARQAMVWAGLPEPYVSKLLADVERQRRQALNIRNQRAKEARARKKRTAKP